MSPSLREALAMLTNDRRFAEITASFNGMNLRQRFPNLTRDEQSEVVRAARGFVQNQPERQPDTPPVQQPSAAAQVEAAYDLRRSPPPVAAVPAEPPPPGPPIEVEEEAYAAVAGAKPPPTESRGLRRHLDAEIFRNPLAMGIAALAAIALLWIVGGQFGSSEAPVEDDTAPVPVASEPVEPAVATVVATAESDTDVAEATLDSAEPDAEPALVEEVAPVSIATAPSALTVEGNLPSPTIPESVEVDWSSVAEVEEPAEAAPEELPNPDPANSPETVVDTAPALAESTDSAAAADVDAGDDELASLSVEEIDSMPEPVAESPSEVGEPADPASAPAGHRSGSDNPLLIAQIQARLKMVGYDPGPIDGIHGPRTRAAISTFQRERGLRVDGEASELLLGVLATYSGLQSSAGQPVVE